MDNQAGTKQTQVLIAGGGLVGLSSAVFLAAKGVKVLLVEKHPGSSLHPRAIGYTPRTLELFQSVGLGREQIPPAPEGFRLRRIRVASLAGKWFEEAAWTPDAKPAAAKIVYSPHSGAAIAQDRLEPILREKALALGAEILMSTELLQLDQDGAGVTAKLRDRRSGIETVVRADYTIAADGHRSPIRTALQIGQDGRGHLRTLRSVLFRAPLEEYLQKGITQFSIDQPGFSAFLTTYGDGRWALMFADDVERDEATLRSLVCKTIGREDLPVELITTGRWELSALIADRFSQGRIFLAGDAAHTLPPSRGGYGANTGIEDAHNLAWKLAAVIAGESAPALLETYDQERRPIAWLRHDQIFARPDYSQHVGAAKGAATAILDDDAMELGQLYRSNSVLGAGAELPPARRPDEWRGQPGSRAPHAVLRSGGSSLDLFQRGWVLVADGAAWSTAAKSASADHKIAIACISLEEESPIADPQAYRAALGLNAGGASLIRPDGYIAWRSIGLPKDPAGALCEAFAEVAAAAS